MMDEYEPKLWTEEECERLCGHCWERLNVVGANAIRKCRHCGLKEEQRWVRP